MSSKELRLLLATGIGTYTVPPTGTFTVKHSASTININASARDGDERAFPFFVTKSSRALEDDLSTIRLWFTSMGYKTWNSHGFPH